MHVDAGLEVGGGQDASIDLDVLRKVALMYPLASKINDLVGMRPTERVLLVAKSLKQACVEAPAVEGLVRDSGVMEVLRDEAVARSEGRRPPTRPLISPMLVVQDSQAQTGG